MNESEKIYEKLMKNISWLDPDGITNLIKASKARAKDIPHILEGISTVEMEETLIQYDDLIYSAKHRDIKSDKDFSRQDFRGALQLYLLGFYKQSIHQACDSVESALIVVHNSRLEKGFLNKKEIRRPFTFGTNISLSKSSDHGFINDNHIEENLEKILIIRNMLIHQYNFLSVLITFLKKNIDIMKSGKETFDMLLPGLNEMTKKDFDTLFNEFSNNGLLNDVREMLDEFNVTLPNDVKEHTSKIIETDIFTQISKDFTNAIPKIENLSDYKWCTTNRQYGDMKKIVDDFFDRKDHPEFGLDIFRYMAYHTLNNAFEVLHHLDFF